MHHTSSTNNPHFPLQNCHIPCIFSPVWPPPPSSRLNLKSCCISSHFNHHPVSPSHHSRTLPPLSQLHNSLSISNLGLVSTNLLVPLLLHFPHGIPVLDSDRQMLQYILMGQGSLVAFRTLPARSQRKACDSGPITLRVSTATGTKK